MDDLDKLAKGLTEAQQRFIRAASARPKKWMTIRRHAKIAPRVPVHGMVKPFGLLEWESPYTLTVRLTPLGLALKAHIERNEG